MHDLIKELYKSFKCINSIFNDGQWNGEESRCNPAESSYKMIANMSAYTVKCSEDQNPCRKAICECDLHYAEQVTSLDFEANHNPAYLQRSVFNNSVNLNKEDGKIFNTKKETDSITILAASNAETTRASINAVEIGTAFLIRTRVILLGSFTRI